MGILARAPRFIHVMIGMGLLSQSAYSIGANHQCKDSDEEVATAALRYEVLRSKTLGSLKYWVLYETTASLSTEEASALRGPASRSLLERNTVDTLIGFVPKVNKIRFVSEKEVKGLFRVVESDPEKAWANFYSVFQEADGLLNVSLPGYSKDIRKALIYIVRQEGVLAAEGFAIELVCQKENWKTTRRHSIWHR